MVKQIIHDDKKVIQIQEVGQGVTFYPQNQSLKVLIDDLESARVSLLLKGINVKPIEDRLGIDPAQLADFHAQEISMDPVYGYRRVVDLVFMPVIPINKKFTTVFKVKHYEGDIYLGYGAMLDKIVVLTAASDDGEYPYFIEKIKEGYNMFGLFDFFIRLRDREGRFNQ